MKKMLERRAAEGKWMAFQNAPYDIVALETLGIELLKYPNFKFYDIQVMGQMVNENWPPRKDLDSLSNEYLGERKKEQKIYKDVWSEGVREYARWDPNLTFRVCEVLLEKFTEQNLHEVWLQKMETLKILTQIKKRGVRVNTSLCTEMYETGLSAMEDCKEILGGNPGSPLFLKKILIDELGLPVLKTTSTGRPSFDKEVMEDYDLYLARLQNPAAYYIGQYRGWQKATSGCYGAYLRHISPDGRVRTNYHLHRTDTGRFSSSDPNLQNIPRESDKEWYKYIKSAFIGNEGFVLTEGDYAQLEFRLGASYAKQRELLEIFNSGRDIFTEMSQQLGMPRQVVKVLVYTLMYGGGINRLMVVFGVSRERATEIRTTFYKTYPNLQKIAQLAQMMAERDKYIELWNGRRRHFQFKSEYRKAFNSITQGGAADIVELAMHRLFKEVDNPECRMIMQVHDSVNFEIQEDKVQVYAPVIKEVMERVMARDGQSFGVDFKVDVHAWSKAA